MRKETAAKILREYERRRSDAELAAERFRDGVYEKHPELRRQASGLRRLCLRLAQAAAAGDEAGAREIGAEAAALRKARDRAMRELGLGEADFLPKYLCRLCGDTGYEKAGDGRLPRMCACFRQRLIRENYSMSNLDLVLGEENFSTFDIALFSDEPDPDAGQSPRNNMARNYSAAKKFAANFGAGFENLLLMGPSGRGKTFICNCIAKALLDRGVSVLYLTAPRLARILEKARSYYEDRAEGAELLEELDSVGLLILDDLGTEALNIVTTSSFFDIINHRLITKRPTVVSTNLAYDDLIKHYSERIVSRFIASYDRLLFFGGNVRERKKLV